MLTCAAKVAEVHNGVAQEAVADHVCGGAGGDHHGARQMALQQLQSPSTICKVKRSSNSDKDACGDGPDGWGMLQGLAQGCKAAHPVAAEGALGHAECGALGDIGAAGVAPSLVGAHIAGPGAAGGGHPAAKQQRTLVSSRHAGAKGYSWERKGASAEVGHRLQTLG